MGHYDDYFEASDREERNRNREVLQNVLLDDEAVDFLIKCLRRRTAIEALFSFLKESKRW